MLMPRQSWWQSPLSASLPVSLFGFPVALQLLQLSRAPLQADLQHLQVCDDSDSSSGFLGSASHLYQWMADVASAAADTAVAVAAAAAAANLALEEVLLKEEREGNSSSNIHLHDLSAVMV